MKKRNTIQRSLIFQTMKELKKHITAEELYNIIAKKYDDISRTTVYRNLNLLSNTGEIRKIEIPGGADCYDYLIHKHYHMKCINCGNIFDVKMDFIEDLQDRITDTSGNEFIDHDIIFKGICSNCNK